MNKVVIALILSSVLVIRSYAQEGAYERLPRPVNVILIAGQSNAINEANGGPYAPRHENIFQLNINDGAISAASDQLLGVGSEAPPGKPTTSFMIPLADLLIDSGKWKSVLLIPIAVGGTYSKEWVPGGDMNARITTIAKQMNHLRIKPTIIIWMQGEGDAATGVNQSTYEANIRSVRATFAGRGMAAPFLVPLETVCYDQPNLAIRAAQAALVDNKRFFAGPDFDAFVGATYRQDAYGTGAQLNGCHFNRNTAWSIVAPMWASTIRTVLH